MAGRVAGPTRLGFKGSTEIVTASTGNHGAATAWAAQQLGLTALVFVPVEARATKLARIEALGAELRREGVDLDEAKELARAEAERRGAPFFEDGAEPAQLDGYASIADELLDQLAEPPAAVVVPTGNGALLGGIGRALLARSPETLRIGVVATEAPMMADSFDAGRPVQSECSGTFADGLAVRLAIPYAVEILDDVATHMLRVTERGDRGRGRRLRCRRNPCGRRRRSRFGGSPAPSRPRWTDRDDRHRP